MEVQDHHLTVSASRPSTKKEKSSKLFAYSERSTDVPLKTIIPLPSEVDQENIKAELKNGVLRLSCPMHRAHHEKKKILITSDEYPFVK